MEDKIINPYIPHPINTVTAAKLILVALTQVKNTILSVNNPEEHIKYLGPSHIIPIEITQTLSVNELEEIRELAMEILNVLNFSTIGINKLINIIIECNKLLISKSGSFKL